MRGASMMPGSRGVTVLLDLDGTLVESAPDLMRALNITLRDAGRRPLDLGAVRTLIGDGLAVLVERGFAATGPSPEPAALARAKQLCLEHYLEHCTDESFLFPGVIDTLRALRETGARLAVCTNKPLQPTRKMLDALGVAPLIEYAVGGDSYPVRKPDPAMLLRTLEDMGASARTAVMVGDSLNDVRAARGAGIPVVFANFGYGRLPANEAIDADISRFEELPAAIDAVLAT